MTNPSANEVGADKASPIEVATFFVVGLGSLLFALIVWSGVL